MQAPVYRGLPDLSTCLCPGGSLPWVDFCAHGKQLKSIFDIALMVVFVIT